jgi:hypothetical protein
VLGVASAKLGGEGLGSFTRMAWVDALRSSIGTQSAYRGRWVKGIVLDIPVQVDRSYFWVGGAVGVGAVLYDRWTTDVRLGLLAATTTPGTSPVSTAANNSGPVLSSGGFRVLGELDETYRVLFLRRPTQGYLVAGLGGAVTYTRLSQTTLGLTSTAPGCTGGAGVSCEQITSTNTHQASTRVWPMVTAGFIVAEVELTYAFQMNVDSVADSTHRVLLGVRF